MLKANAAIATSMPAESAEGFRELSILLTGAVRQYLTLLAYAAKARILTTAVFAMGMGAHARLRSKCSPTFLGHALHLKHIVQSIFLSIELPRNWKTTRANRTLGSAGLW